MVGVLFYEGGGVVRRATFRRGVLAIDPDVGNDNVYEEPRHLR